MTNVCQSVGTATERAYRRRVSPATRPTARTTAVLVAGAAVSVLAAGMGLLLVTGLDGQAPAGSACSGPAVGIALGAPAAGERVGATEYGGPGDPGTGTVGASGVSLLAHPDSYGRAGRHRIFQTATAMGGSALHDALVRVDLGRPVRRRLRSTKLRARRREAGGGAAARSSTCGGSSPRRAAGSPTRAAAGRGPCGLPVRPLAGAAWGPGAGAAHPSRPAPPRRAHAPPPWRVPAAPR